MRCGWSGIVWRKLSSRFLNLTILLGSSSSLPISGCRSSTSSLLKKLIPLNLRIFSLIALIFCVAFGTVLGTTHLMQFLSLIHTRSILRSPLKLGAKSLSITQQIISHINHTSQQRNNRPTISYPLQHTHPRQPQPHTPWSNTRPNADVQTTHRHNKHQS